MNKKLSNYFNLDFFIVFFLVYFTSCSIIASLKFDFNSIAIIYFFIILVYFFFNIFTKKIKSFAMQPIIFLLLILINIVMTMVINSDFTLGYYNLIMSVLSGYFISVIMEKNIFFENYIKVMVLMSLYTLIIQFIIVPIIGSYQALLPQYTNTTNITYSDFGLALVINVPGYIRTIGVFGESGLFQVFLIWALVFELFFVKREIKAFNIFILISTLITTFSSIAYIQLLLIGFAYLVINNKYKEKIKFIILIFLFVISILIIMNSIPHLKENIQATFDKFLNKESSYQGRVLSISSNIKVWLQRPWLGYGITNGFTEVSNQYLLNITTANTSTTTALMVVFGMMFPLLTISMTCKIVDSCKYDLLHIKILLFIVFLLNVNSQLLIYDQFFYIICFSVFMRENIIRKGEN